MIYLKNNFKKTLINTEGDKLGKIFAIYSLAPLVIAIVLFTLFVSRRDLHTATLGVGVILNHLVNQVRHLESLYFFGSREESEVAGFLVFLQ